MLKRVGQWFFPNVCCFCERATDTGRDLCVDCQVSLPWLNDRCFRCGLLLQDGKESITCQKCIESPPSFDRLCALFNYELPVTKLITGLKFGEKLGYGRILGELMSEKVCHEWYKKEALPDALIPVPLHPKRLRQRGFNQALELLLPVKKRCQLPVLLDVCQRVRKTKPQSLLNRNRRGRNMQGVFEVIAPLKCEHIAIVDDVVTTGSTVSALSAALKLAGATQVDIWCICRA